MVEAIAWFYRRVNDEKIDQLQPPKKPLPVGEVDRAASRRGQMEPSHPLTRELFRRESLLIIPVHGSHAWDAIGSFEALFRDFAGNRILYGAYRQGNR